METYTKEEKYLRARKRLEKEKSFYKHLFWYVVVNIFLLVMTWLETEKKGEDFWNFGTFSTAVFWGLGVVVHGASVFIPDLFLGKEWEKRQIARFMRKQEQQEKRWE
ncbi:2TM domain-containing protein [Sinomicrobium oceani]|uniref:2TM domain-containing protein n=1 Tax=Sinomicrobium oceani TaxID=1150368 RepID=UPI00227C6427|nr:2TM domain-containing protein [Sinomicrobium oceani]